MKEQTTTTTLLRAGDTLVRTTVTTEAESVFVSWDEIWESIEVVPDDDMTETPWDNCDGFDHEVTDIRDIDENRESLQKRRGFTWSRERRNSVVISMERDKSGYNFYRQQGASRQVASEMVALARRKRIEQVCRWYSQGWEWWGVRGELKGCVASVWGIDDYDYANTEMCEEIAVELAGQLEDAGYVVTDKPEPKPQDKTWRYRWNKTLFSWDD